MDTKTRPLDWAMLYLFLFGVWPLADPGHKGDTLLSLFDIALHTLALTILLMRWKMVRRQSVPPRCADDTCSDEHG